MSLPASIDRGMTALLCGNCGGRAVFSVEPSRVYCPVCSLAWPHSHSASQHFGPEHADARARMLLVKHATPHTEPDEGKDIFEALQKCVAEMTKDGNASRRLTLKISNQAREALLLWLGKAPDTDAVRVEPLRDAVRLAGYVGEGCAGLLLEERMMVTWGPRW